MRCLRAPPPPRWGYSPSLQPCERIAGAVAPHGFVDRAKDVGSECRLSPVLAVDDAPLILDVPRAVLGQVGVCACLIEPFNPAIPMNTILSVSGTDRRHAVCRAAAITNR